MIEDIEELLRQYKNYLQTGRNDLKGFGHFLVQEEPTITTSTIIDKYKGEINRYFNNDNSIDQLQSETSMLWGHLDRYKHVLIKNALAEVPIKNVDEFVLLIYVEMHGNPRMKDFVRDSLMEVTTCFEMIKRVKKRGLITEKPDPDDKRSKIMLLTEEGQAAISLAKKRMSQVNHILYHSISNTEMQHIRDTFRVLAGYHERVYQHLQNGHDFDSLLNDKGLI